MPAAISTASRQVRIEGINSKDSILTPPLFSAAGRSVGRFVFALQHMIAILQRFIFLKKQRKNRVLGGVRMFCDKKGLNFEPKGAIILCGAAKVVAANLIQFTSTWKNSHDLPEHRIRQSAGWLLPVRLQQVARPDLDGEQEGL
ncbi:MAG: hypothetical protein OXC81_06460 [Betaproteobacteria bacterium]|nr:hypothetical protein [Betaproteobacteria bacterium]